MNFSAISALGVGPIVRRARCCFPVFCTLTVLEHVHLTNGRSLRTCMHTYIYTPQGLKNVNWLTCLNVFRRIRVENLSTKKISRWSLKEDNVIFPRFVTVQLIVISYVSKSNSLVVLPNQGQTHMLHNWFNWFKARISFDELLIKLNVRLYFR